MRMLSDYEMSATCGGEPITIGAVMGILTIALVMAIVYKLYGSSAGKAALPGGFKFEWK